MARLPIPGNDDGTWGAILNDFLSQAHNSDGTLKNGAVDTVQIGDLAVTKPKLSSDTQSSLTKADSSVQSINTKLPNTGGAVTLAPSDIGAAASATSITGTQSLVGGGDLTTNRSLSLVNDAANPGSSVYYGTNSTGTRGFFTISGLNPTPVTICPSFSYTGTIAVYTGDFRWYNDTGRTLTIANARASLGTAPTGSSAIFDVLKNGVTIFSTTANRPTIAAGNNTGLSGTPDVTSVVAGDYLTVTISQIGATTPGADLTLTVVMS